MCVRACTFIYIGKGYFANFISYRERICEAKKLNFINFKKNLYTFIFILNGLNFWIVRYFNDEYIYISSEALN